MKRVRLHRVNRHPNPTLAERIAQALAGNGTPITSEALNSLFSEVADALLDAEQQVTDTQAKKLDPTVLDDTRTALDAAIWRRDKLQGAVSGFAYQTSASGGAGTEGAWNREADAVEQKRDDLTEVFASTYPELISQLIELFARVKEMDQEVDRPRTIRPRTQRAGACCRSASVRISLLHTKLVGLSGQAVWPPPAPPILR